MEEAAVLAGVICRREKPLQPAKSPGFRPFSPPFSAAASFPLTIADALEARPARLPAFFSIPEQKVLAAEADDDDDSSSSLSRSWPTLPIFRSRPEKHEEEDAAKKRRRFSENSRPLLCPPPLVCTSLFD